MTPYNPPTNEGRCRMTELDCWKGAFTGLIRFVSYGLSSSKLPESFLGVWGAVICTGSDLCAETNSGGLALSFLDCCFDLLSSKGKVIRINLHLS